MKTVYFPGPHVRHEHHAEKHTSIKLGVELSPGVNLLDDILADELVACGLASEKPLLCSDCIAPTAPPVQVIEGGMVPPGVLATIGEHGPEAVLPLKNVKAKDKTPE